MRRSDWEQRLGAYLASVKDKPFVWGSHDCALYAASAVEAMTGVDPAAAFRGRYATARGSVRALRRIGAGTLEATFTATFGEPIAPAFLQRGDLVFAQGSVGICMGGHALFVGQEGESEGLISIPRRDWKFGWRNG